MGVSLVDATKFACESLEFQRPLYLISNGVKNCFRTRKKVLRFDVRCIVNCYATFYASFLNDVTQLFLITGRDLNFELE